MTTYHLQAGIAACHTLAPSYEETDWQQILAYYEQLLQIQESLFIKLNWIVALSHAKNVDIAFIELKQLEGLQNYYLYHATLANFEVCLNHPTEAVKYYKKAFDLTGNSIEKQFIKALILEINGRGA